MQKQDLKRAHNELFRRGPDETFSSLGSLLDHCSKRQRNTRDLWRPPGTLLPQPAEGNRLVVGAGNDGAFAMNDWSFGQVCKLAKVGKETINRLSAATAAQVFRETLPGGSKPIQLYVEDDRVRSLHRATYSRLYDAELVEMLMEFAVDFQPPQKAAGGGTGLYAGEQDLFCFLIDPSGWAEIEGEAFAPGFFFWNSEVGRRSLGVQTFWFQAVCQNHIVWDAVEAVEFTRKHTGDVRSSLSEVRRIIERLAAKRDERRDGFAKVIAKAMQERLGADADASLKTLLKNGIPKAAAVEALAVAEEQGVLTIFSLVDALTRTAGKARFAGDRQELDARASRLLDLAV